MLGWIACGWLVGLLVGTAGPFGPEGALAIFSLIGGAVLALRGDGLGAKLWVVPLAALALTAGAAVSETGAPPCPGRGKVAVRASVERVRFGLEDADVWMRVLEGHWSASGAQVVPDLVVRLRVPLAAAPPRQSVVAFEGTVRPPTVLRNESIKPTGVKPLEQACWGQTAGDLQAVSAGRFQTWTAYVRQRIRRRLIGGLPQEVASVARALVLGDGGALPYEQRRTVAAVGLAHLFAVSGLHIALVSGTLVRLLGWLLRGTTVCIASARLAAALGIPLTLLHATLAGGAPSAWRAAVTAALTWGVVALGRRQAPTQVTGAAALLLSAPDPSVAVRPAFLLSIVATSAILTATTVTPGRFRAVRAASTISARTLVATAPLVWWWFGGVPLIGWLTNIVVLPFGSLIVIPLAHLYALGATVPGLGEWIAWALTGAVRLLLSTCDLLAPFAVAKRLPPLDALQGAVVLAACVTLLAVRRWRTRAIVLLFAGLAWGLAEYRIRARTQPDGEVRVAFLDVAQGDAALIDFPDGSLALVDTGQAARHPAGRAILRVLRERRRARIDRVVITHGHPDHFGALPELLAEVEIGELWINGQLLAEETDSTMRELLALARRKGTRVRAVGELCGKPEDYGGATLTVLWPCPRYDPELDLNDNSITMQLTFGNHAFLFTGDLEWEAERRLLAAALIGPIDVLKVAHHGSKTSTTAAFVDATRPALAVVSTGASNRYGHPNRVVLERLRDAGARVFRTDLDGGVTVRSDGEALNVETWRARTPASESTRP